MISYKWTTALVIDGDVRYLRDDMLCYRKGTGGRDVGKGVARQDWIYWSYPVLFSFISFRIPDWYHICTMNE